LEVVHTSPELSAVSAANANEMHGFWHYRGVSWYILSLGLASALVRLKIGARMTLEGSTAPGNTANTVAQGRMESIRENNVVVNGGQVDTGQARYKGSIKNNGWDGRRYTNTSWEEFDIGLASPLPLAVDHNYLQNISECQPANVDIHPF
jgi:hypothetical protein